VKINSPLRHVCSAFFWVLRNNAGFLRTMHADRVRVATCIPCGSAHTGDIRQGGTQTSFLTTFGKMVYESGATLSHVYFPATAIVSLLYMN
jgi:hypothetical protein